ncbi:ComEC/Rec2 family competence protein [Candidatus Saccharibacteria bacterium]|nr:ComEC/Rec2 family competence protein [Candidatus Saccharibacteria bacterium]
MSRVHVSWIIAIFSLSFVIGVCMAQWVLGWGSIVWFFVSVGMIGVVVWRKNRYLIPFMVVAGMMMGLWRGSIDQYALTIYKKLYDHSITVSGTVTDDIDIGKNGEVVARLGGLKADGHELPGKIWVSAQTKFDIKRGDSVMVSGVLQTGFGNFAGAMYRANISKVQRPEPGDVARQVRDWFADTIRLAIPNPQAALGIGFLVGQRRALPVELDQALQIAGLTHIVVASGYNLTILVRLARRLFVSVSKYLSALSATVMIVSFVAITGASPSMARAGLVSGLSLAAWYYGRKFHPLVLLPFAAAITVAVNPSFAWNDLGWQLSFAAFAGVMILAPLLQRYFYGEDKPGIVRQIVGETMSAHIMTLPILVVAFGQVSNVAILANVLILPFVPLAMLLTFIAGVGTLIAPGLAAIIGTPANVLLSYMVAVAEYLSKLPWAVTEVQIANWVSWVAYAGIVLLIVWLWRATKYDLRESNIVE